MASKYVDTMAILQVIGCIYNTPSLLDYKDKYTFSEEDFPNEFHKTVFGVLYKLHEGGTSSFTIENVEGYLNVRPKSNEIYKKNKGSEWLIKVADSANEMSFDYYYNRIKKMSLLRAYDNCGLDVSDIYDPDNILDVKKKQLQEDLLDNSTLEDIVNIIDKKIDEIKLKYAYNCDEDAKQAGEGIDELIDRFKEVPEVGVPLYGSLINTVTRGARLGKFYLRSAATGVGKTRTMIADACYIGCDKLYDETFGWLKNGTCEPVLFIATEQDLTEVQTMMLAFLANVNEEHILNGKYDGDEEDRVREAARLLKASPIYVEVVPDFSLQDIENIIKKNIREHDVHYVFNPIKRVLGQ